MRITSSARKSPLHILMTCAFAATLVSSLALVGCSSASSTSTSATDSTQGAASSDVSRVDTASMDFTYSTRDLDSSYDASNATTIELTGDGASVSGSGASVDGSTVTISDAGTYVLSGSLTDGEILVTASDTSKVQIVLNGASITDQDGPAIDIESGDKVFITLATGTTNSLSDGSSYSLADGEDEPDATIFSKSDLTINGEGSLTIDGNYKDAVHSKDDLVITGGDITIDATDDALSGKDCVKIDGGTIDIVAGGDGIKSSNDSDTDRGFVSIDGGTLTLDVGDDGIQAARYIRLEGGAIDITAADDAIHSDMDAALDGSTMTIDAGDDAVHTEFYLDIEGGSTTVEACYEGFEGQTISIDGGQNYIVSSDDGVNATEGDSGSSDETAAQSQATQNQGRPTGMQEGGFSSVGVLDVTGGTTIVVADGDGLDSNGSIAMSGGVVLVSGPEANDNGSLDYDSTGSITGGYFIALGSSGMAQTFDSSSTQASVSASVDGQSGDLVEVCDSDGNVLISYRAEKSFALVIASTPDIVDGTSYEVCTGGTVSDADSHGFSTSGTVSGATDEGSIEATTEVQGTMGMGGMQGGGGMDGAQNTMPGNGGGTMGGGPTGGGSQNGGAINGGSANGGAATGSQSSGSAA